MGSPCLCARARAMLAEEIAVQERERVAHADLARLLRRRQMLMLLRERLSERGQEQVRLARETTAALEKLEREKEQLMLPGDRRRVIENLAATAAIFSTLLVSAGNLVEEDKALLRLLEDEPEAGASPQAASALLGLATAASHIDALLTDGE